MDNKKYNKVLIVFIFGFAFLCCKREDPRCPNLDNNKINTKNTVIRFYFKDSLNNNINHLVGIKSGNYLNDTISIDTMNRFNHNVSSSIYITYKNFKDTSILKLNNAAYYCKKTGKYNETLPYYYFDSVNFGFKFFTKNQYQEPDSFIKENGFNIFTFSFLLP